MDLSKWLAAFRELHGKARRRSLTADERSTYESAREEFARAMVAAQRLTVAPDETARRAMRVARAVQVELQLASGPEKVLTVDIGVGGFAALVGKPPPATELVGFSLRLPDGDPLLGRVKVVEARRQTSNHRVSFAFDELPQAAQERLEMNVIDFALERFKV